MLCGAGAASAHGLNTSYIDIAIEPSRLSVTCLLSAGEIIAAVLFPATLWLAKQRFRRPVVLTASAVVFIFGVGWFVQRAFDLSSRRNWRISKKSNLPWITFSVESHVA